MIGDPKCLHCVLWNTIIEFHGETPTRDGDYCSLHIDPQRVMDAIAEIVAELIASHPDEASRESAAASFEDKIHVCLAREMIARELALQAAATETKH